MGTMREALEAAFDQHSEPDEDTTEPQTAPEPAEGEPPSSPDESPPSEVTEPSEAPAVEGDGRVRDALGRFVPKAGDTPKPGAPVVTMATPKFEPPPRGVPPTLRSNWTALSPEWRAHIAEAHTRLAQVEEQYRPAVEFASNFMRTIQPYQQMIQTATGGDTVRAVGELLHAEHILRNGMAAEKAGFVASIVNKYGVSIEDLDKALVGIPLEQSPQGFSPQMIQQAVDQRLAPLMQAAQQRRQHNEQVIEHQVSTEMEKFATDPKNEFFEDVRNIMADLVDVADRHGQELSFADAYSRACLLHPEVSKVMLARQQGTSAQQLTQAARRAKAAAVSVKGAAPVGNPNPSEPTSVRAAIEAAIEAHSRV